jgi:4-amino-4-deoxy-L-arabinose transferase-like glycosyltransferase
VGTESFLQETGNVAQSLALGKGFSSLFRRDTGPTAWLTPVYPLLLAGIFRIFGIFTAHSFYAIAFLNLLFSTATCVPIFYAGKRIAGIGAASGAAWLWAIFPNAVIIPFEWVWDTALTTLLAATILWATLELAESRRWRDWCAYGLLWGFLLMTNPAPASLLPFLLGWVAWRAGGRGFERLKRPALAAVLAVLCCAPWMIRNYAVFHRFIPLRSNLPFELWSGNNDVFDENSRTGRMRVTRLEEVRTYSQLGENAYMQSKWQEAIEFMRSHPRLELKLTGGRILSFWTGTDSPVNNFLELDSASIRFRFLWSFVAVLGSGAGCLILLRKRSPYVFPVGVFPLVFPCLYYVTHGDLRLRHPIDPVLLLLMAIAGGALVELFLRGAAGEPVAAERAGTTSCEAVGRI